MSAKAYEVSSCSTARRRSTAPSGFRVYSVLNAAARRSRARLQQQHTPVFFRKSPEQLWPGRGVARRLRAAAAAAGHLPALEAGAIDAQRACVGHAHQVARAHLGVDARAIAAEQLGHLVHRECRRGLDDHAEASVAKAGLGDCDKSPHVAQTATPRCLLPTRVMVGSRIGHPADPIRLGTWRGFDALFVCNHVMPRRLATLTTNVNLAR